MKGVRILDNNNNYYNGMADGNQSSIDTVNNDINSNGGYQNNVNNNYNYVNNNPNNVNNTYQSTNTSTTNFTVDDIEQLRVADNSYYY